MPCDPAIVRTLLQELETQPYVDISVRAAMDLLFDDVAIAHFCQILGLSYDTVIERKYSQSTAFFRFTYEADESV